MPNKTIAELSQELKDAGRDVRMAGEMVERACGGMQDFGFTLETLTAITEATSRAFTALMEVNRAQCSEAVSIALKTDPLEAAK